MSKLFYKLFYCTATGGVMVYHALHSEYTAGPPTMLVVYKPTEWR